MQAHINQLFFFFCCFNGLSLLFAEGVQTASEELSALKSIKKNLIDSLGRLSDWQESTNGTSNGSPHCNWTGVWCNSKGFVERLDLSNMNLSGQISEDIQHLTSLSSLNICCNEITSYLPKTLSNLISLVSIDVSQNNFTGTFPVGFGAAKWLATLNASSNNFVGFLPEDLGYATSLERLDFRGSFFEGSIPMSFKNLQKLKFLGLSGNNLTGRLPRELGQLAMVETIILGYNEFEGPIPAEFGNLSNLRYLDMAVGRLGGQIPAELGKLQKLTTVYLYKNDFVGKIPPEVGNITSLVYLDLSDNRLSGEIPSELAGLENLKLLNLMCNKLTGSIPTQLGELPNLEVLELWKNSFAGPLPANLGKNSPLQWLDVSSNSLSGEIPPSLCNSRNLTKLILFNNSFSGPIPIGLTKCHSLVRVRIQNNLISGTVPAGLGNLPQLQRLELENNNLSGEIPDDISLSESLSFIDFSSNHFKSSLPDNVLSIPNLQTFKASNNNLSGHIPDQFQGCPSLSVLDLSCNYLSGQIPQSIASCEKLVSLNLRGNQLSGEIPHAITTMPTLAILDLSNNSLTGQIPENFGSLPALEMLNLSYNNLEGPVPTNGMFANINPNDLIGNVGLCGGTLPLCSQRHDKASGQLRNSHVNHIPIGSVIGISATIALAIAFLVVRTIYRRWYLYSSFIEDWLSRNKKEWPWRLVAFQRLSFTSTDILACIKESNVIGTGGTGIVYKAEIQRPHTVVAVKKLLRSYTDVEAGDNMLAEVNLLGRLRHRNIVRLLGYLHNESDVMIIYEYMSNGNLWAALHGKRVGKILVDWVSRYNIAVGVAQGLAYLHYDCHPPVIHRDVKSNNILLDTNFEARIADFGLARMMLDKNKTVSKVAGSYGYIAPEYGYTLKVDEKSDIYSFGVVLLELATGKMPLDPSFGESVDIVEWARRKNRDNRSLEDVLDPNVAGQCKHVQEEMLLVLRIALLCTTKLPKDRPSTRDLLTMLIEAKPRRKSICNNSEYNPNIDRPIYSALPVIGLL
ncbi:hypothetical protein Nepgr_001721 [Nepenthes gracilis]|uniref:non-specific serine/threonine protein kinase n=1 Tax=Nepenthes gracilis TaxID=150966 RepID=A0AAD3RW88_NEPGR|nr:hypothetical protein Nepgr_001721 [Nepenthes gracilis]